MRKLIHIFNYLCNYNHYGTFEQYLDENVHIYEMSNLMKKNSGLPANLWIDDTGSYRNSGHWKRIKFQINGGDLFQKNNLGVITISDNPQVISSKNIELSNEEVEDIIEFVKKHKTDLELIADQEMSFQDFMDKIRVDKKINI